MRFNDYSIKEEFKYEISKRVYKHNRIAVELKKILSTKAGRKDFLKILVIDEVKSGHCLDSTIGTVYTIIKSCSGLYTKVFGICVNNGNELKRPILQSLNNMNVDLIFIDDGWWLDNGQLLNFTLEDINNPTQEYIEKSNLISQNSVYRK